MPADCPGSDLTQATRQIEESIGRSLQPGWTLSATVVWRPASDSVVTMLLVSGPPHAPTPDLVADFLAGVYNSIHSPEKEVTRRNDSRLQFDSITVAGTPAIRYSTDVQQGGRALAYLVFGNERVYAFQFATPATDDAQARFVAESLLATVQLPRLVANTTEDPAYFVGSVVGAFIFTGILSRIIWRRRRKTVGGAFTAFAVAGVISTAVASLTMGVQRALPYLVTAGVWFMFDLLRARPAEAQSHEPPPNDDSGTRPPD